MSETTPLNETAGSLDLGPTSAISQPTENAEKSNSRNYVVFVEIEADVFRKIGVKEAVSPEKAVEALVGMEAAGKSFGACPERNWKAVKPNIRPAALSF